MHWKIPAMREPGVLSVGSVSLEFRVRASRLPESGESLEARDVALVGGGRGARVALIARQLGGSAHLISRVGDDTLADIAIAPLRDAGVLLEGTRRVVGASTATAMVWVRRDSEKAVLSSPNAYAMWSAEDAESVERAVAEAPSGSVVIPDAALPAFVRDRAIHEARRRALSVVLNPSPVAAIGDEPFEGVDFLVPSALDATYLTNVDVEDGRTALEAARRLVARRARTVAIRLDGAGVLFFDGQDDAFIEPLGEGSGDSEAFVAALGVALLDGVSSLKAVEFASAASTLYGSRQGVRPAVLARADVDRLLSSGLITA